MFDVHDNLENKPEILGDLLEQPQLCMLLNPNLTRAQLGKLIEIFYIVDVQHEGESHPAIICGFYLRPEDETIEPQLRDMWAELAEEEEK